MPDTPDPRTAAAAAEEAASQGDYAQAERLLRQVLGLQEARLGPFHSDLAHTLNNLGVVCDRLDNPLEAERCYRRAYAIATSTLPSDHPFVATSGKNLRDFCDSRGLSFEVAPPAPPRVPTPPPTVPPPPAPSQWPSGRSGIRVVAAAAALVAVVVVAALLNRVPGEADRDPAPEPILQEAADDGRIEEQESAATPVEAELAAEIEPPAPPAAVAATARPTGDGQPGVVVAELCTALSLSDWRCSSAESPVAAGTVFFYTRVRSSVDTTVLHRWYHGDRLVQQVVLNVRANPSAGYRTFSRNTVASGGDGWRVELRAADGTLLYEQSFVVR
jgi:hypothetical protein